MKITNTYDVECNITPGFYSVPHSTDKSPANKNHEVIILAIKFDTYDIYIVLQAMKTVQKCVFVLQTAMDDEPDSRPVVK